MRWSDYARLVLKRLTHSDWFCFFLSLSSYQCCILIHASVIDDSKGKVHPRTGHESSEGGIYSFFNLGVRWGWVVNVTPRAFYSAPPPGKETRYPLYRKLGGPQGRCGRVRKITPPPGFNPPTIQPVASGYTG
jgi:hypothetical protein